MRSNSKIVLINSNLGIDIGMSDFCNASVYREFSTANSPFATYTVLQEGVDFKPKQTKLNPYSCFSFQSDEDRIVQKVIVSLKTLPTNGEEQTELKPNHQSKYISSGNRDRLENPGNRLLIPIIVQCRRYLGEDDILRHENVYER